MKVVPTHAGASTTLGELDYVELRHAVEGFPEGTRGTVVAAHPDDDAYLVEVVEAERVIECESLDLALAIRSRKPLN